MDNIDKILTKRLGVYLTDNRRNSIMKLLTLIGETRIDFLAFIHPSFKELLNGNDSDNILSFLYEVCMDIKLSNENTSLMFSQIIDSLEVNEFIDKKVEKTLPTVNLNMYNFIFIKIKLIENEISYLITQTDTQ